MYAAREKNGIYIPRDRYLNEEAEKKVPSKCFNMNMNFKYCYKFGIITNPKLLQCYLKAMAEKIERMELDADSKDKVYYVLSNSV